MTEQRASSGVRNLRAMFENQSAASSPEPRGRSPSRRIIADANRPTSKVKASFISVVPNGIVSPPLGTPNSPAANRGSFDFTRGGAAPEPKRSFSGEKEAREDSSVAKAVPAQPAESREASTSPSQTAEAETAMPNLGLIMKGSDFPEPQKAEEETAPKAEEEKAEIEVPAQTTAEPAAGADELEAQLAALSVKDADIPADNPDKIVTGVQEEATMRPADPKDAAGVSGGEALPSPAEVLPVSTAVEAPAEVPEATESLPPKTPVKGSPKKTAAVNGTASAKKPAPISVAKASAARPGAGRVPKTPTTPKASSAAAAKAPAAKEKPKTTVHKEPVKAPAPKTSRGSLRPTATSATAGASTAAAKAKAPVADHKKPAVRSASAAPAPKHTSTTSPTGFKKPRPKSPTRPVRLPSHLLAPTAASASKHDEAAAQKLVRKPSAASRPAATKAAPPTRKPAARAPAVAAAAEKRPASRASTTGGANEGFLARMMRPTASSASKTHDKPASPPRRGASVRASSRPKPGQEGVVAAGKKLVSELATKAKDAVTSGHDGEDKGEHERAESATSSGAAEEVTDKQESPKQDQPEQDVPAVESH